MTHHAPLIASNRVEGTNVINAEGDTIGSIHSLMIDKLSGHVAYAIMSFGGFLGIGTRYHPIPWALLDYQPAVEGYRVHIDRDTLSSAPAFAPDDIDALTAEGATATLDTHYADAIEKRTTLADYRGPKIEGDPLSQGILARAAQPGRISPESERSEAIIDRNARVGIIAGEDEGKAS